MKLEYLVVAVSGPLAFNLIMAHAFDEIVYAVAFTSIILTSLSAVMLAEDLWKTLGNPRRALAPGIVGALGLYAAFFIGDVAAGLLGMDWQVREVYEAVPSGITVAAALAIASLGEELYWRGALQEVALRRVGLPWWASSLLYASGHIASGLPLLALAALVAGLILGFIAHRWGIVASAISHYLWLLTVFYIAPLA